MLTPEQRARFRELGLTRLVGGVDPGEAQRMRARIWAQLAECEGIRPDAPETWPPGGRIRPSALRSLHAAGVFDAMGSPAVRGALDELLGAGAWQEPCHWGQLLMSMPQPGAWSLPHKIWHFDYQARGDQAGLPGVQLFLLLDRLEPRGGGTVLVGGCHQLVQRMHAQSGPDHEGRSAELRKALRRTVPWVRELLSAGDDAERAERFMHRTCTFQGVALRVIEVTGEAGDVVLMHPWILHAPAPNAGARPRIVLTERIRAEPVGGTPPGC